MSNSAVFDAIPNDAFGDTAESVSFADLMSQVDHSRARVVDAPRPKAYLRANPVRANARPLLHPAPFGHPRAVGGCFEPLPGILPTRDLTVWELQKAVAPERSWPGASSACVAKPFSTCSRQMNSTQPTLLLAEFARHEFARSDVMTLSPGHQLRPVAWRENNRKQCDVVSDSDGDGRSCSFGASHQSSPHSSRDEVLSPVRCTKGEDVDDATPDWLKRLHARRQGLLTALASTDVELRETRSQTQERAPTPTRRARSVASPTPTKGGPFAGKKSILSRSMAKAREAGDARRAADAYSYLGPGSDGPPVGQVHPLWP